MNYLRTTLFLSFLTALFVGCGYLIGGQAGLVVAFVIAFAMNAFAYWNSDKLVLSLHRAQPVDEKTSPGLFRIVQQLADRAGLPMPALYMIDQAQPNAFATGRNPDHSAIAVTTGLVRLLSPEEVAGVVAHELAHIKNRDTLTMTITATLAGAISLLANFGMMLGGVAGRSRNNPLGVVGVLLVAILAPLAAMLVQLAISRGREYEADRTGARISGQPLWLASALAKIAPAAERIDNPTAEVNPASAHLFIVNPLHMHRRDSLFATHPSVENRIARLRALAGRTPASVRGV